LDIRDVLRDNAASRFGSAVEWNFSLAQRLDALLAPTKADASKAKRRAEKKRGRSARRAETAALKEQALEREGGCCAVCCRPASAYLPLDPDHFWGVAKAPQSIENVWLLCRACHDRKTENKPDRAYWLQTFRLHARRYGYRREVAKVDAVLDSDRFIEEATQTMTRGGVNT
jgi:hypothetical protein